MPFQSYLLARGERNLQQIVNAILDLQANLRFSWLNTHETISGPHTVVSSEAGSTLLLDGNTFYTLTLGPVSGYPSNFLIVVDNVDANRGKNIVASGLTSFILWPGQSVIIFNNGTGWGIIPQGQRWVLSSLRNLYVNASTGNNSNDGLDPSSPLLTVQAAINTISSFWDIGVFGVNINVQTAITESVSINGPWLGSATPTIIGNTGSPITWNGNPSGFCLAATSGGRINVEGFLFQSNGFGLLAQIQGTIIVSGTCNFGACTMTHVASNGGVIAALGISYTISGAASTHITSLFYSSVLFQNNTITISGTPAITTFVSILAGSCALSGSTIGGTGFTGQTYNIGEGGDLLKPTSCVPASPDGSNIPGTINGTGGTTAGGGFIS